MWELVAIVSGFLAMTGVIAIWQDRALPQGDEIPEITKSGWITYKRSFAVYASPFIQYALITAFCASLTYFEGHRNDLKAVLIFTGIFSLIAQLADFWRTFRKMER